MSEARPSDRARPVLTRRRWPVPAMIVALAVAVAAGVLIAHYRRPTSTISPPGGGLASATVADAAAGTNVIRPGWTWAMPTEALSVAYDPSGNPDEYYLIDPAGYITYHNSVPVSTMAQLLAAAGTTAAPAAATSGGAGSSAATLP